MIFQPSQLALQYLRSLKGLEIGAAAHNPFYLDTINADIPDSSGIYSAEQIRMCGMTALIDVPITSGDSLPFPDSSFDFVISSHVLEHFYDPIAAIREWCRVSRKYVFVIIPHIDRTFDKGTPATSYQELLERHAQRKETHPKEDAHYSFWRLDSFLPLLTVMHLPVIATQDPDDKVGNGFAVLFSSNKE